MGMDNLLNYYFIMIKRFVTVLLASSLAGGLFSQQPWFKDKDLTLPGAYYYPEDVYKRQPLPGPFCFWSL